MELVDEQVKTDLKIAVISDLHAYDDRSVDPRPSHLCASDPEDEPETHPISGLLDLIAREKLRADVLLCCGDIADKAMPESIKYAWAAIQRVRDALGAQLLAATAGNHDIDSRHTYNAFDPKGFLQSLDPPFPLNNEGQNDAFWARNFVIMSNPVYRLVVLNSSAFHGGPVDENWHGRVSDYTIAALRKALKAGENRPINLLLCHHHPLRHKELQRELDPDWYDEMKNGQKLLDLLGSGEYGDWLIIHGHRHFPKICYAAGGASAPIIFSAGSLCAQLYLDLQTLARNQFYLIELPHSDCRRWGLVGTFHAWDWAIGEGWIKAGAHSGLPYHGGFGYRTNLQVLARSVADFVDGKGNPPIVPWQAVTRAIPQIRFLLPGDTRELVRRLRDAFGLGVEESHEGPIQIGKRA
ncbi:MAG: metallophosphoesterase [Candidatus Marsarchaeota archaeon]|nr:metallophosphoesterase [Candidatus Marsarchaeota archaeon]